MAHFQTGLSPPALHCSATSHEVTPAAVEGVNKQVNHCKEEAGVPVGASRLFSHPAVVSKLHVHARKQIMHSVLAIKCIYFG